MNPTRRIAWRGVPILGLLLMVGCRPPPLEVPISVRHHTEVAWATDGSLLPVFLGEASQVGLCMEVEASVDTSRWVARLELSGQPLDADAQPTTARLGPVLCFDGEIPPGASSEGELELCGVLEDQFDGSTWKLPCQRIGLRSDTHDHNAIYAARDQLMGGPSSLSTTDLISRLDELAGRADNSGFPAQAIHLRLMAVYFLRRSGIPEDHAEARRRLDELPGWLSQPAANSLRAKAELEYAALESTAGATAAARAWQRLGVAEGLFQKSADPLRLSATIRRTAILSRQGLPGEAAEQLQRSLESCRTAPCRPAIERMAESELGWYTLLDPFARSEDLARAENRLQAKLDDASSEQSQLLEQANDLLNLASLKLRRGVDGRPALQAARDTIAQAPGNTGRAALLSGWGNLLGSLFDLDDQPTAALDACRAIASSDPQLAAAAASCMGRAQRRLGKREAAAQHLGEALVHHALGSERPGTAGFGHGPGPRAEDFQRLARLDIERDRLQSAWRRLEELDALAPSEQARRDCRDRAATPETIARWQAIEAETEEILAQLAELRGPKSGTRREQLVTVRRALQNRWLELRRDWPGCDQPSTHSQTVGFRAFALEDEVVLLRRDLNGHVKLVRRTQMDRPRLREIIDNAAEAIATKDIDIAAWRANLTPLAAALVPAETPSPVSYYHLHGLLQGVPVAALPVGGSADEPVWLINKTVPVLVPARSQPPRAEVASGEPVFVVDPAGNLPGATELVPFYRRQFPRAQILTGEAASSAAVRQAVKNSGWLHIAAHGHYESSFPDLSTLALHDDRLTWPELAELAFPWAFANLSGCLTGRWHPTPDSGRYGLAGLLTQVGVQRVVASRANLPDRFAADLNRAFYEALDFETDDAVALAYGDALRRLSRRFPPSFWATTMILGSPEQPKDPQEGAKSQGAESS